MTGKTECEYAVGFVQRQTECRHFVSEEGGVAATKYAGWGAGTWKVEGFSDDKDTRLDHR